MFNGNCRSKEIFFFFFLIDAKMVTELEDEIRKIESQVNMWLRELAEIKKARTKLEVFLLFLD